jgi:hypothetical protein
MTMEHHRGLAASQRRVILLLDYKVQLFLVYLNLFSYSPVKCSLMHDDRASRDHNASGSSGPGTADVSGTKNRMSFG